MPQQEGKALSITPLNCLSEVYVELIILADVML